MNTTNLSRMNDIRANESQAKERAQKVFTAIKETTANNPGSYFRVGGVSETLRNGGFPLGSWEVRGEFTTLAKAGYVKLDAASARWQLTDAGVATDKI